MILELPTPDVVPDISEGVSRLRCTLLMYFAPLSSRLAVCIATYSFIVMPFGNGLSFFAAICLATKSVIAAVCLLAG